MPGGVIIRGLHHILDTGWQSTRAFRRYQGVSQSAALAFYALLSFIPLLFLSLAVAGWILDDAKELKAFIETQLQNMVPWMKDTLQGRIDLMLVMARGVGWVSLAFSMWTSGLFFSLLQGNLLLPWQREHDHKKGVWRLPLPWVMGPALGFLLCGAMLGTHVAGALPDQWLPFIAKEEFLRWVVLALSIFLFYKLLLPLNSPWGITLILSFLIAGLSQALTTFVVKILAGLPNYTLFYGSLAGLIFFLLWLNYYMVLILWCGHYIRIWGRGQPEE